MKIAFHMRELHHSTPVRAIHHALKHFICGSLARETDIILRGLDRL